MTPTETPLEIRKDNKIGVGYKPNTLIIIKMRFEIQTISYSYYC